VTIPWAQNDALFIAERTAGHEFELAVADALLRLGFAVQCKPPMHRADISKVALYADQQDILAGTWARPLWIEVKSRKLKFTDDPATFPYDTTMVDTLSGWQAKPAHPVAVVLISQATGAKLVVPVSTATQWGVEKQYDHTRGIMDRFLCAPRDVLRTWQEFTEWLEKQGRTA